MKSKIIWFFVFTMIVVIALIAGLYIGKKQGKETVNIETEKNLKPLIDMTYPKPPDIISSRGGTIKAIVGGTINLEIINPDDYLPHPDGSPNQKEIRFVSVDNRTKFISTDFTKRDAKGVSPLISEIKFSDLKIGDTIKVQTTQNIRTDERFDATSVELVILNH